ncbi:phosphonate C-P lyase system protein PhnG [Maritalea sp.]|uniref:phosphonate C-P lyase system protein PhnG n=1 Tax=Maritalea sp. TaxID=2003361 RepID=UPI003EF517A2
MADQQSRHSQILGILARAESATLKSFAEEILAEFIDVEVVQNRTGLVMLPMQDTVEGTSFHLGEVLVSEAHIKALELEGYGMRKGRDLEASMAMAVVDLAWQAKLKTDRIEAFIDTQANQLAQADDEQMRAVEATRVNMETF